MGVVTETTKIEGLDDLIKRLEALPIEAQAKLERKVLKPAAEIIKTAAQASAPVLTGNLRKSFSVKVRSKRGELFAEIINIANHAHLIEFGHVMRSHLPKKKIIRVVGAQPFMRPALSQKAGEVIDKIREVFLEELEKIARKSK